MKQTKAPATTPSPKQGVLKTQSKGGDSKALTLFIGAVFDLSWQMAIVVLVPIIGGYELDKSLHTTPALTIIGFILTMVGTYVVIKKTLVEYSGRTIIEPKGHK
jgi:hypothetical protein